MSIPTITRSADTRLRRNSAVPVVFVVGTLISLFSTPLSGQTNIFPSSGNVGIGTVTPAEKLDMSGGALAFTTTLNPASDVGYPKIYYGDPGDGNSGLVVRAWKIAFKSGNYTDTTTKMFINNNGNVGIGTTNPGANLDIVGTATSSSPQLRLRPAGIAGSNSSLPSYLDFFATFDNYPADYIPRRVATIKARYSGGVWGNEVLAFEVGGSNDTFIEPVERMRITAAGNVGIGTTNPGSYKLAVEGTIGAREVIVTSFPWADYVFRPGYRLRPLSEVNAYIKANGHLPEIPTETEVKEKGINLGDMQAKLLAKVEELTLHVIQQEKEIRELREQVNRQNKESDDLRRRKEGQ